MLLGRPGLGFLIPDFIPDLLLQSVVYTFAVQQCLCRSGTLWDATGSASC